MTTQQMADWKAENARIHAAAQAALSKALRDGTVPTGTPCGMTTVYADALAAAAETNDTPEPEPPAPTFRLLPYANHPGFSVAQFDAAVDRAHRNNLRVTEVVNGVAFVTSATKPGLVHRVTRTTCNCAAHRYTGRCAHRALCVFLCDMMGGFDYPRPNSNIRFLHRRQPTTPAA